MSAGIAVLVRAVESLNVGPDPVGPSLVIIELEEIGEGLHAHSHENIVKASTTLL